MADLLKSLRARLDRLAGRRPRRTPTQELLAWAARVGYGARGFVYLSAGVLILLAATDRIGDAVGARGAITALAEQPLGRLWILLLALGLSAFVMWRGLQAVFDADHEGLSRHGIMTRLSQGFSGLAYGALAFSAFSLLFQSPPADAEAAAVADSHAQAAKVLALPFGHWILTGAGLAILGLGLANVVRAWREDFTEYLACSAEVCRRVAPLARIGYVARGVAWLPLGALVVMAGLRSRASDVTSFGAALDAVERQPLGPWLLGLTALGFIAFGAFSFVEARFRRIRPPRELKPLP